MKKIISVTTARSIASRVAKISQMPSPIRSFSSLTPSARDPKYATLSAVDVDYFTAQLGSKGIIQDKDMLNAFNTDWQQKFRGHSQLVLQPENVEQLSRVLEYCNERKLAVVPQGGNTGLVGGGVPLFDEVIVSTRKMNKILGLDNYSGIVTAEAGCVLADVNSFLEDNGFMMPLDLGAKGTCQIGGNVSTNAGGLRYLRYGSLRGNVLGMEMVLPDGTIVDNLTTLRKDNTGYDLKQLFIGGEGTLGIISKLAILAPRRPLSVNVALVAVESYEKVLETVVRARSSLSELVSAVEFLDNSSLGLVLEYIDGTSNPLAEQSGDNNNPYPFYMVIETHGSNEEHDMEKLLAFLEGAMEDETIVTGVVAQDQAQFNNLWALRENVALALTRRGAVYKYDISLPLDLMYTFVDDMQERLSEHDALVIGYGHLGDGNLHLNVSTPEPSTQVHSLIEPYLFEKTAQVNGSVSAEHGMGQCKNEYMSLSKPKPLIDLMQNIKSMIDPNGIMNPYKVLPSQK